MTPRDLTIAEKLELSRLKRHLFGEERFLVLTPEIEASPEYKRYNHLVKVRQMYLSHQEQKNLTGQDMCFN